MTEEKLTKVHIDLPNHWAIGGESFWAKALGNDLYQIENVPFFAYGLNYHDIVKAISESQDLKPEIQEVVKRSGHKTIRVIFTKTVEREQQVNLLDTLEKFNATYERADAINVAIDIKTEGNYNAVYDLLEEYIEKDYLSFETCEARNEGSFDDTLEDK